MSDLKKLPSVLHMLAYRFVISLLSFVVFLSCAHAEESLPHGEFKDRRIRAAVSVGGSWEHYTGENAVAADVGRNMADARHIDWDLNLALYFMPASDSLNFGIAFDFANDNWSKDQNFVRISQLFVAFRAEYYFGHEIGKGWFAHGDLGLVNFNTQVGNNTGRTDQLTNTVSPIGVGIRAGGGYAVKVSDVVSLFGVAEYGIRTAGASTAAPLTLSLGVLF